MKCLNIKYLLFFSFLSTTLSSQNPLDPGWLWAKRGGSTIALNSGLFDVKHERVMDVKVDANNNYYYLAEVGGNTFTLDTMTFENYNNDPDIKDIFVFSTDSEGNFRWSKLIGGGSYDYASSLDVDAQGNVYVSGLCINYPFQFPAVHFDSDSTLAEGSFDPSPSNKKIFIIKYDSSGNFQWLRQPESDSTVIGFSAAMLKMIVEPNGTTHSLVALTEGTYFDGQLIIPPMDTIANILPTQTAIIKYDSAGVFQDYILFDMKPVDGWYLRQMAYDAALDRYYIANTYTTNFTNEEITLSINGYGADSPDKAFCLAALNSQGEVVWYHENTQVGGWSTGDVQIDDMGNIYFTGYGIAPDSFAGYEFMESEGFNDNIGPFLIKLNSDGNLLWGTDSDEYSPFLGQSMVISGNDVYLGLGMLENIWNDLYIPGPSGIGLVPDIQIIRFGAQTGQAQEVISNNAITPTRDAITAMALDTAGALIVGGYFGSTLFGGTDLQIQDTGPDSDFFIAKYQPQGTDVGIDEASPLKTIKVYPNPTSGVLNLQSQVALTSYTLCDLQGRVVKRGNLETKRIDLSGLESGVYVLGVRADDGNVWNTKVVVSY